MSPVLIVNDAKSDVRSDNREAPRGNRNAAAWERDLLWRPEPMGDYALKLHRAKERPEWRSGLTFREALILVSESVEAEEHKPEPRYLTATIYRGAMAVSLSRYFPPKMRAKDFRPDEDGDE